MRRHRVCPQFPSPLLPRHPPGTLQGSVNISLTLSHPYPYRRGITDIPSLKYPPTSLPFAAVSLPVVHFDVLAAALPSTSDKTAHPIRALGAWSLPLVTPNITALFHVVIWGLPLLVTTLQETTTFRILGSEVVPQVYNGGNVTE